MPSEAINALLRRPSTDGAQLALDVAATTGTALSHRLLPRTTALRGRVIVCAAGYSQLPNVARQCGLRYLSHGKPRAVLDRRVRRSTPRYVGRPADAAAAFKTASAKNSELRTLAHVASTHATIASFLDDSGAVAASAMDTDEAKVDDATAISTAADQRSLSDRLQPPTEDAAAELAKLLAAVDPSVFQFAKRIDRDKQYAVSCT